MRGIAVLAAGWTAVALAMAAGYRMTSTTYEFRESLGHFLPFYLLWAGFTPAVLESARALSRMGRGRAFTIALHVLAALAISAVQIACYVPLALLLEGRWTVASIPGEIATGLRHHMLGNLVTYGCLTLLWHLYDYRVRTAEAITRARLEVLRTQLEPHFLLNTLQVASSLMHSDVAAAEEMLEQLGEFLRLVLRRDDRRVVPVAEELLLLQRYTAIMQLRFGDRLRVVTHVDPPAREALVPPLLLQPLVENAIRHGIGGRADGGTVTIRLERRGDSLDVEVEDDGAGIRETVAEGMGLSNTRERLRGLYAAAHDISLRARATGGTSVRITIPFERAPASAAAAPAHPFISARSESA
jgi:two-component system LytT family sensor kinase